MNVPFVDLKPQYQSIKADMDDAIHQVLDKGIFILGENVEKFEEEFGRYLGGGYAVSVGSGTDALSLSLLAAGIGPGHEVITVSHTFVATYISIIYTGASPVLVDIDPATFTMDAAQIEAKITPKTRALVPVHLYGQPADMDKIMAIAEKHNLLVIEDACQAHGSRFRDQVTGLRGHMGCFSFYPTKNLGAYGDGGMVVTRDETLKEQLLLLRNYGQTKKYYHERYGINSRLDEMQAAVLRVKLKHLDRWNSERRDIARMYSDRIKNPLIACPVEKSDRRHVYHLYVVRTPGGPRHRDKLQDYLKENGIHTQIHYPVPVHLQRCYQDKFPAPLTLPHTETAAAEILSLPLFNGMREDAVHYVIETLNRFVV
jgi:dTDP-4-amino-4,6-dideoxygalactose transaminase